MEGKGRVRTGIPIGLEKMVGWFGLFFQLGWLALGSQCLQLQLRLDLLACCSTCNAAAVVGVWECVRDRVIGSRLGLL